VEHLANVPLLTSYLLTSSRGTDPGVMLVSSVLRLDLKCELLKVACFRKDVISKLYEMSLGMVTLGKTDTTGI
jgi:hypothetical protein